MRRSLLRPFVAVAARPLGNVLRRRRTPRSRRLSALGVRSAVRARSRPRAGGRAERHMQRGARRRSATAGLFAPRRAARRPVVSRGWARSHSVCLALEVDVARGGVEGSPSGGGEVGAQEPVYAGGSPPVVRAGDELANDPLHDCARCELDEAELGSGKAQQRRPWSGSPPGQGRREQREPADSD